MLVRANGARAGATAVEFAVIAPVIFALVFGIIELGRALMVTHILADVARDASRYAVVTEGANQTSADIQSYATGRLSAYGISTVKTPVVSVNDSSATDLSASVGPAQQTGSSNFGKYSNGSEVTVKVQVNFSEVSWLPFADYVAGGAVLSGQYTLRRDPM
jgi:Flp pilus assembly protein TadG